MSIVLSLFFSCFKIQFYSFFPQYPAISTKQHFNNIILILIFLILILSLWLFYYFIIKLYSTLSSALNSISTTLLLLLHLLFIHYLNSISIKLYILFPLLLLLWFFTHLKQPTPSKWRVCCMRFVLPGHYHGR